MDDQDVEEKVYQFYTVINNLVYNDSTYQENNIVPAKDSENVLYVTVPSVADQNEENSTQFVEEPDIDEDHALPICNLKLVTLSDGQVFLTTDDSTLEENLTSIQPQLLSAPEENRSDENETLESSECLDVSELQNEESQDTTQPNDYNSYSFIRVKSKEYLKGTKLKQKGNYICAYVDCGKSFTSGHHLSVHTRLHTGSRPYSCGVKGCDKTFVTNYSLKAHTRIHTGEKPYGCGICSKHFKTAGDLQKHIRTHTGEKPFKCPIKGCDKSFSTSNIRKVHIRSHTGERPYVCTVVDCGKAFSSATNYKNHIRIHSGEKPYCCAVEGCGRRFTEYSSLYKHKVVHNPTKSKCYFENCNQVFRSEGLLKQHHSVEHNVVYLSETSTSYYLQSTEESSFVGEDKATIHLSI